MTKPPVRVAVTGGRGPKSATPLLFRLAAGEFLGPDQPVFLQLLEIPPALPALDGVMMELEDCAFPTLAGAAASADPAVAFRDADYAFLVGARPRGAGMERADLLLSNAEIFREQGPGLERACQPRSQGRGGGQPREHQRPDRHEQRAGSGSRPGDGDDAPGPQQGPWPVWRPRPGRRLPPSGG